MSSFFSPMCRSQPTLTRSAGSRCVQDERCGVIWPKSMPCTGEQIPGEKDLTCMVLFHSYVTSDVEQSVKAGKCESLQWCSRFQIMFTRLCCNHCCSFFFSVGFWSVPPKMGNSLFGTAIPQTRWVLLMHEELGQGVNRRLSVTVFVSMDLSSME